MSEITKLYENAGIKPEYKDCCIITDKYLNYETELSYEDLMDKECPHNQECTDECEYAYNKIIYPPFTAEKQLELVKLCFEKYRLLGKTRVTGDRCVIYNLRFPDDYPDYTDCATWEEAIAGLINKLWQSLTEEEKQQVKGILE